MSNPIIKLQNIDFYYDKGKPTEVHALQDINVEIERGDFVSFFGPSGCGKSTILYVIAGIDRPEVGSIVINDYDMRNLTPKELAIFRQMGIGIIFQSFNLIPSISIMDNVMLPMAFLGIPLEMRTKKALQILERVGIQNIADRFPYELSGGQQQRVGIARALANDPPIILADEPTGNLDSTNAIKTMEFLQEFNLKEGKTVILVTHEIWSLKYANKIFHMMDGKITKVEAQERLKLGESIAAKTKATDSDAKQAPAEQEPTEEETKLRFLGSSLMRGYSEEEVRRFENVLVMRLRGQIDKTQVFLELDKPFKDGGVGLWEPTARHMADAVEDIVLKKLMLTELSEKLSRNPGASIRHEVVDIRQWLVKDYEGHLSPYQIDRLDAIIKERIHGTLHSVDTLKIFNTSKKDGGLGLRVTTSVKLAEKLENLLASYKFPDIRL